MKLLDVAVPNVGIKRVYYYQWREPNTTKSWDTGVTAPDKSARPIYNTLKSHL